MSEVMQNGWFYLVVGFLVLATVLPVLVLRAVARREDRRDGE
jgi:hypothetical protein